MHIFNIRSDLIIGRRPFLFIEIYSSSDPIDYFLWNQCGVHLSDKDTDKANGPQVIWSDFYWSILQWEDIWNQYSSEFIWKISLLEWREWRFDEIVLQFPAYYNSISITDTQSIFMDRAKDLEDWSEGIKPQKLSYIYDVCNWFLLPNVLCQRGCLEFIHKIGHFHLDTIIQWFIKKFNLSIVNVSRLYQTENMRNDYLLESNNDYYMWLHNPDWGIWPTIDFLDWYHLILTCKYHDGG